jgi:hypothetical protein
MASTINGAATGAAASSANNNSNNNNFPSLLATYTTLTKSLLETVQQLRGSGCEQSHYAILAAVMRAEITPTQPSCTPIPSILKSETRTIGDRFQAAIKARENVIKRQAERSKKLGGGGGGGRVKQVDMKGVLWNQQQPIKPKQAAPMNPAPPQPPAQPQPPQFMQQQQHQQFSPQQPQPQPQQFAQQQHPQTTFSSPPQPPQFSQQQPPAFSQTFANPPAPSPYAAPVQANPYASAAAPSSNPYASAAAPSSNPYAAQSYAAQAYGGYGNESGEGGMRRRPNTNQQQQSYNPYDDQSSHEQQQQQQQQPLMQRNRQNNRLDEAHLVEKTLSELTSMFSSLSNIISLQGDTLEKIEDDVVQAGLEVDAGAAEINKTYDRTKGNRSLILKIFCVLAFLIVIFKLY